MDIVILFKNFIYIVNLIWECCKIAEIIFDIFLKTFFVLKKIFKNFCTFFADFYGYSDFYSGILPISWIKLIFVRGCCKIAEIIFDIFLKNIFCI